MHATSLRNDKFNARMRSCRYNGCGGCACKGAKTCSVVSPFGPTTPTKIANNGMCPHLGYNYTSTKFDGTNLALTYYAESDDGVSWVKPELGLVRPFCAIRPKTAICPDRLGTSIGKGL
jgi:hypothetical protein